MLSNTRGQCSDQSALETQIRNGPWHTSPAKFVCLSFSNSLLRSHGGVKPNNLFELNLIVVGRAAQAAACKAVPRRRDWCNSCTGFHFFGHKCWETHAGL